MADYQVFISYRRTGGSDFAGRISDNLKNDGYRVFFDVDSMRSGKFNAQIYEAIDSCEDVLLILPAKALDRCTDPEDWVRKEIEYSIRKGKNIIPIMMDGFEFPKDLPESIASVSEYEGVKYSSDYFGAVINRIEQLLKTPRPDEEDSPQEDPESDLSRAVRFLNYGMYPQALASIEKAMQSDQSNPEVYFYAAVATLQGKRPFLVERNLIKKAEEYLQVAIVTGEKGIYYYLWAYIQFDHYHKKMLRSVPGYQQLLQKAKGKISEPDIAELFELMNIQRPTDF